MSLQRVEGRKTPQLQNRRDLALLGAVKAIRVVDSGKCLYYASPAMLLLHAWNRFLALTLLSGALLCILVPGCDDGADTGLTSQQQASISSLQSNFPSTPSEAECWCCCAHVITASFQTPTILSPLMQTDVIDEVRYIRVDLPIPTQPPRV
jgi:hypothetical protein